MKKINIILSALKGVGAAVAITVIGVALMALLIKGTTADAPLITGISVAIKIISIVAGVVIAAIKIRKKGALIGGAVAIAYWAVCMIISLLAGTLQLSLGIIADLLLTVLSGAFAGILTVNTLK